MDDTLPFPHPRHCPTQAEVIFHKEVAKRLEEDIKAAQEMDEPEDRLQYLQKAKANHASYISPLRRLPVELLSEIVYLCIQDDVKVATLTQICGTLRDVAIRLPSLWNKVLLSPEIKARYEEAVPGFHRCRNREHLDLILARTKSNPLHVYTECPPSYDMLSLLSYHRAVIVSLTVDAENNFSSSNGINSDGFETLNLDLLEEINLKSIGHEDAGLLMDSALQSTCEMNIRLAMELITPGLFGHELLKRAIRLDISAETGESFTSPKIQLPYLKSLVLDGDYGVFDAFDLRDSGMEELTCSSRYREYISPTSLPIQLRSLILSSVDFVSKPPQPHPLVHLTTLEFGCTTLEYPLQEYIALPKLKHLDIYNVLFEPVEDEENPDNAVSNSNQSFLRVLPELETISIKQMTLDGSIVKVLQFCPQLKSLTLEECDADLFFRSFLSCLYRKDIFQSLDTFGIILSWPWKYMTFEEFVELCTARRPGIDISWDNCYY